jgi:hypothetical protein
MDDAYLSTVGKDRQAVREQQAAEKPAKSAAKPAGKRAGSKRGK